MFITGVKTAIVEALVAGFNTINPNGIPNITRQFNYPSDTSIDLTPNSVTIEYPLEEVQWPAIFVQFRPSKSQWTGMNPDVYTSISGTNTYIQTREIYFEGVIDFQILAMHSEERDRLWDSLYNLILMDPNSPASNAFYSSINANDLVAITLLQSTVQSLGDTVSPGTPYSPEELTYESTLRVQCIGESFESKYNSIVPAVSAISVSGTLELLPHYTTTGVDIPVFTIS
jgi:hypothetical protein